MKWPICGNLVYGLCQVGVHTTECFSHTKMISKVWILLPIMLVFYRQKNYLIGRALGHVRSYLYSEMVRPGNLWLLLCEKRPLCVYSVEVPSPHFPGGTFVGVLNSHIFLSLMVPSVEILCASSPPISSSSSPIFPCFKELAANHMCSCNGPVHLLWGTCPGKRDLSSYFWWFLSMAPSKQLFPNMVWGYDHVSLILALHSSTGIPGRGGRCLWVPPDRVPPQSHLLSTFFASKAYWGLKTSLPVSWGNEKWHLQAHSRPSRPPEDLKHIRRPS